MTGLGQAESCCASGSYRDGCTTTSDEMSDETFRVVSGTSGKDLPFWWKERDVWGLPLLYFFIFGHCQVRMYCLELW